MTRLGQAACLGSFPVLGALFLCACAGASPLMHPAHTLSEGKTRFAAGSSAQFALGEASTVIDDAQATPIPAAVTQPPPEYIRGAVAVAALAPGISPFVSARVGVGYQIEGGLAYTGRTVRIDGRHAVEGEDIALSFGVGGSAILQGRSEQAAGRHLAGLDLGAARGWGVDLPVLFGWRSSADLVWWWTGARGGYERLDGEVAFVPPQGEAIHSDVSGSRLYALGVMGFAVGMRTLHAAVEVQGGYQHVEAIMWDQDVTVASPTLSPAAALVGTF